MRYFVLICLVILITIIPTMGQDADPIINTFIAQEQMVVRERLADGSQRVTVNWDVANRPESADLYFEQIVPGPRIVNIELPRDAAWVNSSGSGMIAPVDPGADVSGVLLLMRMVDRSSGRLLDFRIMYLPVVSEAEFALSLPTPVPPASVTEQAVPLDPTPVVNFRPTGQPLPVTVLDFHIYNEFPTITDDVLLVWEAHNADTVWINGVGYDAFAFPADASVSGTYTGGVRLPVSQLVSGSGQHTITMTAQSSHSGASASASFTIDVREGQLPSQPLAEILSFTVSPTSVRLDGTVTLAWETRSADALSVSSWLVENSNGYIKTVALNPSASGSITLAVRDLVDQPGSYWIGLDAQSFQPGWAGSGHAQSIYVMP